MALETNQAPGIVTLVTRLGRTFVGAIHNRAELLALEWQQERGRLAELIIWAAALAFLVMMSAILLTTTIILLCPADARVYVTAGFALLYLIGAAIAWFGIKKLLKSEAFEASIEQAKKDREWLKSLD